MFATKHSGVTLTVVLIDPNHKRGLLHDVYGTEGYDNGRISPVRQEAARGLALV